jgi:undecaprenyl-diphosphatase
MEIVYAVVLGIVQGLTEFLPISSSGHLVLAPWLLGWEDLGLSFDAALHLGTAVALLAYFWREWVRLGAAVARGLVSAEARRSFDWRFAWLLFLGSVPVGLIGIAFERPIEELLRSPVQVALLLIGFGLLLLIAERLGRQQRKLAEVGVVDALVVGCSQALALAPGVSRSGVTMTAGLFRGLTREAAARFSFLLSAPITVAAGLYKLRGGVPPDERLLFGAGVVAAAVTGVVAIWFLLRWVQTNSFLPFVLYRVAFGLVVLGIALGRG